VLPPKAVEMVEVELRPEDRLVYDRCAGAGVHSDQIIIIIIIIIIIEENMGTDLM
jgi:hypothetical protein